MRYTRCPLDNTRSRVTPARQQPVSARLELNTTPPGVGPRAFGWFERGRRNAVPHLAWQKTRGVCKVTSPRVLNRRRGCHHCQSWATTVAHLHKDDSARSGGAIYHSAQPAPNNAPAACPGTSSSSDMRHHSASNWTAMEVRGLIANPPTQTSWVPLVKTPDAASIA